MTQLKILSTTLLFLLLGFFAGPARAELYGSESAVVGELYDLRDGSSEGTLRRRDSDIYQYDPEGKPKYVIQQDNNGNLQRYKVTSDPFEDNFAGTVVRRTDLDPEIPGELPQPTFQVFDEAGNFKTVLRLKSGHGFE